MTYQIVVRERGSDHDVVLCEVGSNPHAIAEGARQKVLHVWVDDDEPGWRVEVEVPKYERVRVVKKRV